MKIMAICGSPRAGGNTEQALDLVLEAAAEAGLETEHVKLRDYDPRGCTACMACREAQDGKCHGRDDGLNEVFERVWHTNALVVGSPVYFGCASAETCAFLQRLGFTARGQEENLLRGKVGAGVGICRRGGGVFTVNQIEGCFGPLEMVRAGSVYWPMGLALEKGSLTQDAEGVKTMKALGANLAWIARKLHEEPAG
jgi:multimeric flavodoxin WrbA